MNIIDNYYDITYLVNTKFSISIPINMKEI